MFTYIRSRLQYLPVAILLPVLALAGIGATTSTPKSCVGTYLVEIEQAGVPTSEAIWTFSQDGTLQSTDSAEDAVPFSHSQGAWIVSGGVTKLSYVDFRGDGAALPTTITRFDATLTPTNKCQNLSGTATLYFFDASTGDPLDITTAESSITGWTFTARQLLVTP
jgi:hypothetical protein